MTKKLKYSSGDLVEISRETLIIDSLEGKKKINTTVIGVILYGRSQSTYIMDRPYRIQDVEKYTILQGGKVVYVDEFKILKKISERSFS